MLNRQIITLIIILFFGTCLNMVILQDWEFTIIATTVLMIAIPLMTRWRFYVPFIFGYMTISGFVSNWLYPSKVPLLFLDFIVILVYAGFFIRIANQKIKLPFVVFNRPLQVLLFMALVQFLNPNLPNYLAGVIGLKTIFFYIPLAFIAYVYCQNVNDIWRIIKVILCASLIASALGLSQFMFGDDVIGNFGEGAQRAIVKTPGARDEQVTRVTGTFARPQLFGLYCMFIVVIGSVTTFSLKGSWRMLGLTAATLAAICLILSGSRTPLALTVFIFIVSIFYMNRYKAITITPKTITTSLVALSIILITLSSNEKFDSYVKRFSSTFASGSSRINSMFISRLEKEPTETLLGNGTGIARQASRHVSGGVLLTSIIESNYLAFFVEFGIIGLGIAGWWYLSLCTQAHNTMASLKLNALRILAIAITSYMIVVILSGFVSTQIDQSPTGIYFWFFYGVLLKLPKIEDEFLNHVNHRH